MRFVPGTADVVSQSERLRLPKLQRHEEENPLLGSVPGQTVPSLDHTASGLDNM